MLDQEKAKAWLAKGAQPTDRVLRLLDSVGVAKREARINPEKAKPRKKAQERAAAAEAPPPRAPQPPSDWSDPCASPTASSSSACSARRRACAARSGSNRLPAIPSAIGAYGALTDATRSRVFVFERLRALKDDMLVVKVKGVETREAAASLTGVEIFARRDQLPPPEPGEFYYDDLVGLEAVTREGQRLGRVAALSNYGAGDILEIALEGGGENAAPALHPSGCAPIVDFEGGRIVDRAAARDRRTSRTRHNSLDAAFRRAVGSGEGSGGAR